MKQDPLAKDPLAQVTALLERAGASTDDENAVPAARDEAIARIAGALRQRRRQRRNRHIAMAAAAIVLLGLGAVAANRKAIAETPVAEKPVRETPHVVTTTHEKLADGSELRTPPSSEAQLDFDRGSRVTVGADSRLRLVEQSRRKRFALESGTVRAKVAKLEADERFVVTTGDSEIEVRGTEFSVSVVSPNPDCGGGTTTRVDVSEGVVVVRHDGHEDRVAAGESWPRCAPTPAVPPVASSAPVTVHSAPHPPPPVTNVAPSPSSRLAEQNDLFQEAMSKKRAGDAKGALEALDRLRGYGDGPLAENAEVERFRILSGIDKARGAAAARDYLKNRPRGFARAEAESLAGP